MADFKLVFEKGGIEVARECRMHRDSDGKNHFDYYDRFNVSYEDFNWFYRVKNIELFEQNYDIFNKAIEAWFCDEEYEQMTYGEAFDDFLQTYGIEYENVEPCDEPDLYDFLALIRACKIGVYEYKVKGNKMIYISYFGSEGFYKVTHNLDTGEELRKYQRTTKLPYNYFCG